MRLPPSEELVRHRLGLCAGCGCLACGIELRLAELVDAVASIDDPRLTDRVATILLDANVRLHALGEGGGRG